MRSSRENSSGFPLTAESVADATLESCETGVLNLMDALFGKENAENNSEYIEPLYLELLVFALQITDRIVFAKLGSEDRAEFMNELLSVVKKRIQSPIKSEFRSLYNSRTAFYASFQKLLPDESESPKGTLFWEFGKALGAVYCNSNPVSVTEVAIFAHFFSMEFAESF